MHPGHFRPYPLEGCPGLLSLIPSYNCTAGDTQVRTAVVVAHEQPEVMAALAAIALGIGALNVLGIPLNLQNIISFRATAATIEGRNTRARHSRRPAVMMTLKALGITSITEADA